MVSGSNILPIEPAPLLTCTTRRMGCVLFLSRSSRAKPSTAGPVALLLTQALILSRNVGSSPNPMAALLMKTSMWP